MQNTAPKSITATILSFGLLWVTLNTLLWGIGITIGYSIGDTVGRRFSTDGGYWVTSEQKMYLVNIVASLILGLAIGLGQALLFQKYRLLNGWRWLAGTVGGFLIVALIANMFDLRFLPLLEGWLFIGGFDLPPKWLRHLSPWNQFLTAWYGTAGITYLSMLGITVGLFQWALQEPKNVLTAWWFAWNLLGLVIAFISIDVLTLFEVDNIFPLSILAGFIYGFLTIWPIVFRLDKLLTQRKKDELSTAA